jgi:hypothetical protein
VIYIKVPKEFHKLRYSDPSLGEKLFHAAEGNHRSDYHIPSLSSDTKLHVSKILRLLHAGAPQHLVNIAFNDMKQDSNLCINSKVLFAKIPSSITNSLIQDGRLHNSNLWTKTISPSDYLAVEKRLIKPLGSTNMIGQSSDIFRILETWLCGFLCREVGL